MHFLNLYYDLYYHKHNVYMYLKKSLFGFKSSKIPFVPQVC